MTGTGKVRAGKINRTVRAGDCIMNPPGEPHHMKNTGNQDLTYYVVANKSQTDMWHYPDSNKWGFSTGKQYFKMQAVSYCAGEE